MKKNVLILIDIQQEYTTPGRPFYLHGIEPSLANCAAMLKHARDANWTIAHVIHYRKNPSNDFFNANSPFSNFVEGFEPHDDEMIFTKHLYSCYSSNEFTEFMTKHTHDNIYIIGYNSIMCCLSTVIDGYHRGHTFTLIEDATLAKSTDEFDELDMHRHSISLIKAAGYAEVITSKSLL
jgi:nicotinamidase-related amidase